MTAPLAPAGPPGPGGASYGRPLLVIEDDEDTRAALVQILSDAGYRVISSDEGRKAIELASVTRPALVLLDLVTGGMDGWEFLERRRSEPALADVPVVFVTGHDAPPPGAAAVLQKPVGPAEIIRTVRQLLPEPRR